VLDALWGDERIGRRDFDVEEIGDGVIALSGVVRARRERVRALRIARAVKDVASVEDRLVVEPGQPRRRLRPRKEEK
jgi:osmotically-inducible protein OsmY